MEQILTQKQLEHRLGVTSMTIFLWRKGYKTMAPLPCTVTRRGEQGHKVIFSIPDVRNWLHNYRPKLEDKLEKSICKCRSCDTGTEKPPKESRNFSPGTQRRIAISENLQ